MEKAKGCELAFAGNDMECRGMFQGFCGVASGLVDYRRESRILRELVRAQDGLPADKFCIFVDLVLSA